ncbi:xanthine dehydrogenase accessory protein XdhC [Aquamicrobium sp. LC103]|uniref:xanthine dehydrogenase accessory protein XdhC n=1 Tax=Aquamicrobium sp. LC103 TaxID=1120658 RepID=UPI00063EC8EE|nr:xanthine dehydrogenase accessory protein XdhC [Aquamicrobium sp. LC103]TKT77621.1 xanthine dehydrogenase accessory protein XdhC [Aquamicrobium sp. LC103]
MTSSHLSAFFAVSPAAALVEVAEARGSTPREKGAWMLVSPDAILGTIGGGQLEFMAIDKARELLADAAASARAGMASLSIPLGPEIGQCCGGRVELAISPVDKAKRAELLERESRESAGRPHVYLFGGGHVGHALAAALALLPVKTMVVETRAAALEGVPATVETSLTPVPEEAVRAAPPGSAFIVLTHDHALDFLIVAEALKRDDAAYVGMIGSKTKKATFRSWYLKEAGGSEERFMRLVSPIGGAGVDDKRPAVIAALAAAEVIQAFSRVRAVNPR